MKKIFITIILLIFTVAGMLIVEISIVNGNIERVEYCDILVLEENIAKNDIIEKEDVKFQKILMGNFDDNYVTDMDEVVGKYYLSDQSENFPLDKNFVSDINTLLSPKDGNLITALKLNPDEALCWQLSPDEEINVMYIDNEIEGKTRIFSKIYVIDVLDSNLSNESNDQSLLPLYIIIEGSEKNIKDIISWKDKGRFELYKK